MNRDWDTPPNGDFARYVERLTAQMALPRPDVQQAPNVIDDVAERPTMQAHRMAAPAPVPTAGATATPRSVIGDKSMRGVLLGVVVLLAVLHLVFDVSLFVLVMVAAVIGWIVFSLRGFLSGRGAAALRERIEQAAREAGRRP